MVGLDSPWFALPLALGSLLALARLARLRPVLRPLVVPFGVTVVVAVADRIFQESRVPTPPGLVLVLALPLLVLLVRAVGLAFEIVFRRSQGMAPPALLESVVAVLLYGVGVGVVAHHWFGIELTPFLATSAVVGAVVGLALQDTLGNLFAGIALHTEAPFRVGDWVRVGDRDGLIDQVSWRATRLRTWDGDTLTLPNNEVARHGILNYSQPARGHTRLITIGVSYSTPPNRVLSVLAKLLEQVQGMPAQPAPVLRIVAYHDFAIVYEIRFPVPSYDEYRQIEGEINRLIWYHFRRHGIEILFPISNVYLHPAEAKPPQVAEPPSTRLERALRNIDLFRSLTDETLRLATGHFRSLHYAAGERIIEEGSPGDSFFVIDRGEVQVSKRLGGVLRDLARLMEGQFFGEMALLTGEQRSATVVAVTDVDLFTIDKAGFHDVLVSSPAFAVDVSTILAERREALLQVEGDAAAPDTSAADRVELKQRILKRIRGYFGL